MNQHGGGLQSDLARLEDAYKVLLQKWDRITEQWRDGNAAAIEEQFLTPLGDLIRSTTPAIGQINDQLTRAVRDCSERDEPW